MGGMNARRRSHGFCVALLGLVLLVGSAFAAAIPVPSLGARVTDQTGTLSRGDAQALEDKLAAFEQGKGGQIAVLIVPTTGAETIELYSIRVVDQWKLGRKGFDDGVLLLVAKDDHKVRIEVGRGYEGVLPDAIANRIIDGFITPKFLGHDYAGGLNDGVDRIIGVVNGGSLPQPAQVASGAAAEPAAAGAPIPPLTGHVVNQTTLITAAQALELEQKLAKYQADKGRRIAILLAMDIGTESCEDYAQRVFKAWNLGSAAVRDDGVLVAECEQPFGHRIVVGRDLQATITPAIAERIYSQDMVLKMIGGDELVGLSAGVDRIVDLENGKPMPAAPENSFDWGTASDWFAPPPFGTWTVSFTLIIFLGICAAALLGHKSTIVRGGGTAVAVGAVPLVAGSGIGFALGLAALGFYLAARYAKDDGPDIPIDWNSGSSSSVSGWSILGSILGMVASSAISGGGGRGGGGGFSGGGGGFSGGGASGSW